MKLVSDAMNRSVVTVSPDAWVEDAAALVRRTGAEHLLVVDEETLVGILCACDLSGDEGERVFERMTVPVLTVRPDADAEEAARTMGDCEIGCLPVAVGGLVIGTLGAAELQRAGIPARPHCHHRRRRSRRPVRTN